jgi:hypothetical protein
MQWPNNMWLLNFVLAMNINIIKRLLISSEFNFYSFYYIIYLYSSALKLTIYCREPSLRRIFALERAVEFHMKITPPPLSGLVGKRVKIFGSFRASVHIFWTMASSKSKGKKRLKFAVRF